MPFCLVNIRGLLYVILITLKQSTTYIIIQLVTACLCGLQIFFGVDEFVVAHSKDCADSTQQVARRIRSTVENTPVTIAGRNFSLTTTIGVSDILWGESKDSAFLRADEALVAGKKRAKNQVVLADPAS